MTILTPNYSLPVPGPLDEPCDFPAQWCDFTTGVQTVLDTFEAIADRTNPNVPVAKLELRNAVTLDVDSHIPFDTLTLNNAGMVDFDASNNTITIKRPGRYLAVCNALFAYNSVANMYFVLQILAPSTHPGIDSNLNVGLINVGSCASAVFHVTTPPRVVRVQVDMATTPSTLRIDLAALTLFWYADGATP